MVNELKRKSYSTLTLRNRKKQADTGLCTFPASLTCHFVLSAPLPLIEP